MKATVITCTEQESRYGGMEKVCDVTIDGEQDTTRIYAKSKTKAGKPISYYPGIKAGARVQLTPKSNGPGYFFQKVLDEEAPAMQPAPLVQHNGNNGAHRARSEEDVRALKKAQMEYIETKAGQLHYAYSCLLNEFGDTLLSEETLRAFASTISISLDREGPK